MNTTVDKYLKTKIFFAKVMGFAVLFASFQFSANGFGFKTHDSLFIGWILALAVTSAQLIFNTQVRKLNWTIVVIGIIAYAYSIWTNILGFYVYRGETDIVFSFTTSSIIPICGGAFMDIFPEMALAWSYGAGMDGDLIGNLAKLGQVDAEGIHPRKLNSEISTRLPKRDLDNLSDNTEELPFFLRNKKEVGYNSRRINR